MASRWVRLQFRVSLASGDVWLGLAKSGGVGPWFGPGSLGPPGRGCSITARRVVDDTMTVEAGYCVVATAWSSEHAAGDGNGRQVVPAYPARLPVPSSPSGDSDLSGETRN
jgi:hypothetical protein